MHVCFEHPASWQPSLAPAVRRQAGCRPCPLQEAIQQEAQQQGGAQGGAKGKKAGLQAMLESLGDVAQNEEQYAQEFSLESFKSKLAKAAK